MIKAKLYMDTVVKIQVVTKNPEERSAAGVRVDRAFQVFHRVEQACSRFTPESEVMKACQTVGKPVKISPFLFEPLKFALNAAELTSGEFDPAIGKLLEEHGYNRHYLTQETIYTPLAEHGDFRDIVLDEHLQTLYLKKPLIIDLGAVAKGFAIDLAANELRKFAGFIINAGGDVYAGGSDENGQPWEIGIQHPKKKGRVIETVNLSDEAICTSGSYERMNKEIPGMHHMISPRTKESPNDLISSSVIAPFAMMADAFSTITFLLGREKGRELLESMNLKGLLIKNDLQIDRLGGF
ncbi:FAD:protein FMN transferase [Peribacillus kribbensis]|uniref:FAD:protein FMN transferase n=1 Tax=Peribacillus kribbensis TaxID=356658 RepID=UPI0003FA43A9|nr:FAD:protein FMN transferase [Peribacillus kribbensis]